MCPLDDADGEPAVGQVNRDLAKAFPIRLGRPFALCGAGPWAAVGHYTDRSAATGCTVVLCEDGAVGGVSVRGSAPGTRETDLLRPTCLVLKVHAVLLSGGSAFGLDAASGVVRYLEAGGVGLEFGGAVVPIVPAAVIFDLGAVTGKVRPGPEEGYAACQAASDDAVQEGSVGAGTGATVRKLLGLERAVRDGLGTASTELGDGLVVGAVVVVNAVGGVYDPYTGEVVAGPRKEDGRAMYDSMKLLTSAGFTRSAQPVPANTTIGAVATNALLNKEQTNKFASVAHDGLAMSVRPAHTMSDGDVMFAVATGRFDGNADIDRLCAASALCISEAVIRGVRAAESAGDIPPIKELGENETS